MGLKGYRLWAMGQLDSNVQSPTAMNANQKKISRCVLVSHDTSHSVALQVAFERQTLKPVFHLIGYRLWV
jgi:hypothetical protein